MLKQIFIFITALAMFIITVSMFEFLVPFILGIDGASAEVMQDPVALKSFMERQPAASYIGIMVAHAVGALIGGAVLGFGGLPKWSAYLLAGICMAGGIGNVLLLPGHPAWFWVFDLVVYIPSVLLGHEWVSQARKFAAEKAAEQ
ncbi:MAG: hypothetical protein AB8F78_01690 [Saprospiraceae bacterium]